MAPRGGGVGEAANDAVRSFAYMVGMNETGVQRSLIEKIWADLAGGAGKDTVVYKRTMDWIRSLKLPPDHTKEMFKLFEAGLEKRPGQNKELNQMTKEKVHGCHQSR